MGCRGNSGEGLVLKEPLFSKTPFSGIMGSSHNVKRLGVGVLDLVFFSDFVEKGSCRLQARIIPGGGGGGGGGVGWVLDV